MTRSLIAVATMLAPACALAHGFGRLYNLPVPFWLYAWGSAATLIVSFLLVGLFATTSTAATAPRSRQITLPGWLRSLLPLLQAFSVLVLMLSIATALFGNRDPYRNFGMIAFWVTFVLGLTYLTAMTGNVYARLNPWRALAQGINRLWRGFTTGRIAYPAWLGDWPALALYLGFISFELFGTGRPFPLGVALLGYTGLTLFAVWLFGAAAWFRHGECFAVFLRLIGMLAPLHWRQSGPPTLHPPMTAIIRKPAPSIGAVTFALAMLSTTAFDGLSATQWWVQRFWSDPYGIVHALLGAPPMSVLAEALPWYRAWEAVCLLASPFLYLAVYLLCIWMAKRLTGTSRSLRDLALDFGYSLLPISLVYHMTHYATLLLTDGLKILSLISDPFGWGWNLFGTTWKFRAPILPDMAMVWHSQVGLILLGHILSVYVAHRIALRVFSSRRQALLSQLPMLLLMVSFTVAGLWILAAPLTVERMT